MTVFVLCSFKVIDLCLCVLVGIKSTHINQYNTYDKLMLCINLLIIKLMFNFVW